MSNQYISSTSGSSRYFTVIPHIPAHLNREQLLAHLGSMSNVLSLSIVRVDVRGGSERRVGIVEVADRESMFRLTSRHSLVGNGQTIKHNQLRPNSKLAVLCSQEIKLRIKFSLSTQGKQVVDQIIDFLNTFGDLSLIKISVKSGTHEISFKAPSSYSIREFSTELRVQLFNIDVELDYTEDCYHISEFEHDPQALQELEILGTTLHNEYNSIISERTHFFNPEKVNFGVDLRHHSFDSQYSNFPLFDPLSLSQYTGQHSSNRPSQSQQTSLEMFSGYTPYFNPAPKQFPAESPDHTPGNYFTGTDELSCSEEGGEENPQNTGDSPFKFFDYDSAAHVAQMFSLDVKRSQADQFPKKHSLEKEKHPKQPSYEPQFASADLSNRLNAFQANWESLHQPTMQQLGIYDNSHPYHKHNGVNSNEQKRQNHRNQQNPHMSRGHNNEETDNRIAPSKTSTSKYRQVQKQQPSQSSSGMNVIKSNASNNYISHEQPNKQNSSSNSKPTPGSKLLSLITSTPPDLSRINDAILPQVRAKWRRFSEIKEEIKKEKLKETNLATLSEQANISGDASLTQQLRTESDVTFFHTHNGASDNRLQGLPPSMVKTNAH